MIVLKYFCVVLLGYCCHGFLLDDNSLQSLLTMLNNEKAARNALENELVALRSTIEAVDARQKAGEYKVHYFTAFQPPKT